MTATSPEIPADQTRPAGHARPEFPTDPGRETTFDGPFEAEAEETGPPKDGQLVIVRDADGNAVRVGIVVGQGRTPSEDRKESWEPLIWWFGPAGEATAYGGELHSAS